MKTLTIIASSVLLIFLLCGCSDSDDGPATPTGTVPAVPTGLSVTAYGMDNISLTWDASDSATEYTLYRSDRSSGDFTQVYAGAATEFADDGLIYATPYYYQVSAGNSAGESDPSDELNVTTRPPTGFTVTGSPQGAVDYTFNYHQEFNGKPHYQSDPIGLNIMVPASGDQAGLWCIFDQIEGIVMYYHATVSDFPPQTGWVARLDGSGTDILLTAF